MKIGEIIKNKDRNTYEKLMKILGNRKMNYDKCMRRKCDQCKFNKKCFKKEKRNHEKKMD